MILAPASWAIIYDILGLTMCAERALAVYPAANGPGDHLIARLAMGWGGHGLAAADRVRGPNLGSWVHEWGAPTSKAQRT